MFRAMHPRSTRRGRGKFSLSALLGAGAAMLAVGALLASCGGESDKGSVSAQALIGGGGAGNGNADDGGPVTGTLVTVDPAQRFQTITGWEVTANAEPQMGPSHLARSRNYAVSAVNQAGITRLRLEVRSGVEGQIGAYSAFVDGGSEDAWKARRYPVINDNADPHSLDPLGFDFTELDHMVDYVVLPMRQAMAARGEELYINVCYVSFLHGIRSVHEDPEEYAEFALATMLHLRQKYGLEPDSWEVMLEPDNNEPHWDGRRIGRSIVATGRRFDQNGIRASFVAPSTTNMTNASPYFDGILGVEGAVERMSELSYHRYRGVSDAALAAIERRARQYGLGTAMFEWWFGRADRDTCSQT